MSCWFHIVRLKKGLCDISDAAVRPYQYFIRAWPPEPGLSPWTLRAVFVPVFQGEGADHRIVTQP